MSSTNNFFKLKGDCTSSYPLAELCGTMAEVTSLCPICGLNIGREGYTSTMLPRFARIEFWRRKKECPDVFYTTTTAGCYLVSDRVVNDLRTAGITEFKTHLVPFQDVPEKRMPPWQYWLFEPFRGTVRYRPIMDENYREEDRVLCPYCQHMKPHRFGYYLASRPRYEIVKDSIVDYDMVWVLKNCFTAIGFSERVVDLAREKKWTNAWFEPFENEVRVFHEDPNWRERLVISSQKMNDERPHALQEWYAENPS